jgi:hypothetical protein
MAYRGAADGVTQRGRTKGKNLGDSGPNIGIEVGKKPAKGIAGGKTNEDMLSMGRNLAKVKANGK